MRGSRITEKVRNPGKASFAIFASMLFVSVGSWGVEHAGHGHEAWIAMFTPQHIFSFVGVIGSVLGAWLSKSPLKE